MRHAATLALVLTTLAAPVCAQGFTGHARVVDGDTLDVEGTRVRMFGIDAPESSQSCSDAARAPYPCGRVATEALASMVGGRPVTCEPRDRDRYGRVVAVCSVGGVDLNRWMVARGLAVAYVRYSTDYAADEARARQGRLGLWAGEFQNPSDYRAANRGGYGGYGGPATGSFGGYGGYGNRRW